MSQLIRNFLLLLSITLLLGADVYGGNDLPQASEQVQNGNISLTLQITPETCDRSNGEISVFASGGTPPYSFSWSHNSALTASNATNLPTGIYSLSITDADSCVVDTSVFLPMIAGPVISSIIPTFPTCGISDGAISLTVSGVAPFNYGWSHDPFLNAPDATALGAGVYTIIIVDANGCTMDTSVLLSNQGTALGNMGTITNISCPGESDGGAIVNPSSIVSSISWSNGQTGDTLSNVPAGTYTVTLLDTGLCRAYLEAIITEPDPVELDTLIAADSCGQGIGRIEIDVASGGTSPFNYQWLVDGDTLNVQNLNNLSPGNYPLILTDANDCETRTNFPITEEGNLRVYVTIDSIRCRGDSDASITLDVQGGSGNYEYTWNPDLGTTNAITQLDTGIYYVTVVDTPGAICQYRDTFNLEQPSLILPNITVVDTDCPNNNGSVSVSPTGGTPPYTVTWQTTPVQTGFTIDSLYSDIYYAALTDANGCYVEFDAIVQTPTNHQVTTLVLEEDACGRSTGRVLADVTGGTPPFLYYWTHNASRDSAIGLNIWEGWHDVYVRDSLDCLIVTRFYMPGNPELVITDDASSPSYCGLYNGTASVSAEGGTPPYDYRWYLFPQQTDQTATKLEEGTYQVDVIDSIGCVTSHEVSVDRRPAMQVEVQDSDVICFNDSSGTVNISVEGNWGPLSYVWEDDSTEASSNLTGLVPGLYYATVRDSAGCKQRVYGIVDGPEYLDANFLASRPTDSLISIQAPGVEFTNLSQGATSYLWDFGDGNISTGASPEHAYQSADDYYVTLYAFNAGTTCVDSMVYGPIQYLPANVLYIPNAFTPNGDGHNDRFEIKGESVSNYHLQIFDRQGGLIFESKNINTAWDGKHLRGKAVMEGVYVYRVSALVRDEVEYTQFGSVTLIR